MKDESLFLQLEGTPLPSLGPVLDFLRKVWAFDHALQRRSKYMEVTLGITAPQRLALRVLGRFPGMSAGQLAEILHLHPGTLSGLIQRLEKRGLVNRQTDPRDRRRALLGLTAKGRELNVDAPGTVEEAFGSALEGLPQSKIQATVDVLEKLCESLNPRP